MRVGRLAQELGAELVWGASASLESDFEVDSVGSASTATDRSVVFAEDAASLKAAIASQARAVLATRALWETLPWEQAEGDGLPGGMTAQGLGERPLGRLAPALLLVSQPRLAFARAARLLAAAEGTSAGVHAEAVVAEGARLGVGVAVGPYAVIEEGAEVGAGCSIGAGAVVGRGVVIGADCRVYPRVVIYPGTRLGARVVVHAGAVLGSDGFGYVRDRETGAYLQFPQQGVLVIEDDVEIGANTTVDRGALEETRIGRGAKLDNLVHVGHNVHVGADVVIAAQTGISGSSVIGEGAVIAGQVGIADHVEIGPGVIVGAQGGVPSKKKLHGPGVVFWGTPARPIAQYLKELAQMARLARRAGKSAKE